MTICAWAILETSLCYIYKVALCFKPQSHWANRHATDKKYYKIGFICWCPLAIIFPKPVLSGSKWMYETYSDSTSNRYVPKDKQTFNRHHRIINGHHLTTNIWGTNITLQLADMRLPSAFHMVASVSSPLVIWWRH